MLLLVGAADDPSPQESVGVFFLYSVAGHGCPYAHRVSSDIPKILYRSYIEE